MTQSMQQELATFSDHRASSEARLRALTRLKSMGDPAATFPLTSLLPEIEAELVGPLRATLQALGASAVLSAGLRDPSAEQRAQAARLLGYLQESHAVEALIVALEDPEARVRELAAGALAELPSDAAVEPLVRHLGRDPDPSVRAASAQALGQMVNERAYQALVASAAAEPNDFTKVVIEISLERAQRTRDAHAFSR